ncbi:MAG TPA: AAA family ATPase [Actinomycetota bacterium]|nr:AAA family ATPase [Actinomycetota bacterium]
MAQPPAPLVGRSSELALLSDALEQVTRGHQRFVLVEGEPGIGKTRLLQEAAVAARGLGFEVLDGRADDLTTPRPFSALADALDRGGGAHLAEVRALLAATTSDAESQYRAIEAVGTVLEDRARGGPVLLSVEDIHVADAGTLAALRSIRRRTRALPVAMVLTSRIEPRSKGADLLVDEAVRDDGVVLRLGPLADDEVVQLVGEIAGGAPGRRLVAQVRRAGGNPLFASEFVRSLLEEGAVSSAGGAVEFAGERVPEEFTALVVRRVRQLSDDAADVLRTASVLGQRFAPAALAAVLSRPVSSLMPPLREAVAAGFLADPGDGLSFRHGLVRDAIYTDIPPSIRTTMHAEVWRALEGQGASAVDVAPHVALSATAGDLEAAGALRTAARQVVGRAPETAVELLERAREIGPDDAQLLADLATALGWCGRVDDAQTVAQDALNLRPPGHVEGTLRTGLARAFLLQGRPQEALTQAAAAEHAELDPVEAAALRADSSLAHLLSGDLATAEREADTAVSAGTTAAVPYAVCTGLAVRSFVDNFRGYPSAVRWAQEAVEVAARDPSGEAARACPSVFLGHNLLLVDRFEEAEQVLRAGQRDAMGRGSVWQLPLYHVGLGMLRFFDGRWDDAVAEVEAALDVADEFGVRIGLLYGHVLPAMVAFHRDDLAAAEGAVRRGEDLVSSGGPQAGAGWLAWARALLLEASGRTEDAVALLAGVLELDRALGLLTEYWSLGPDLVRMAVAVGATGPAQDAVAGIEEVAERLGTSTDQAAALRCRGVLEDDPDMLLASIETYRTTPRHPERAFACEDAAVVLASAGRSDEAVTVAKEALDVFEELGATRPLNRMLARLRERGVRLGATGRRGRPRSGWEALTPTELEVVRLVAEGMSNPEIAGRLFVSRHTVASHLKHVFQKLGVRSRAELAAAAVAHSSGR